MGVERTLARVGPKKDVEFAKVRLSLSEGVMVELAEKVGIVDGSVVVLAA